MSRPRRPSSRPPFDPRRVRTPAEKGGGLFGAAGPEDSGILTVTQVTRLVAGAIRQAFPREVHVLGELSNVSESAGGHLYFTLKDTACEIRCAMWRSSAANLRFQPADGLEVVATGSVEVYEPRGQYQLYVRRLEPRGVGALELAFRQLKERLEKEGLFDPARKKPLPRFPQRIAVITSLTGAAVRDILQTIRRRYPCVQVWIYDVRVQGDGAAGEIAEAIRRVNHSARELGGVDVLIVGRGGGSLEDLWAFNEEIVAWAIFASRIPVVSAVGHEVDFTIADFVADIRAATPTAAAELVVPVRDELLADLARQEQRQGQALHKMLQMARLRLAAAERSEWFRDPVGRVRRLHQQLDEATGRLRLSGTRWLNRRRSLLHELETRLLRVRPEAEMARRREGVGAVETRLRLAMSRWLAGVERRILTLEGRLSAISPEHRLETAAFLLNQSQQRLKSGLLRKLDADRRRLDDLEVRLRASSHEQVLRRGYTITRLAQSGRLVRKPGDVHEGDRLQTETAEGSIASRVVDARQGELFD